MPGGGRPGGSSFLAPRFDSSSSASSASPAFGSFASDPSLLLPHGGAPTSFSIKSAQQCPNRYSEPDNRDWRGWSVQLPASSEEKSWENLRENREFGNHFDSRYQDSNQFNRQDQLNSQFARAHISSNQGGPSPTLIKAEVPWSARRGNLSEKNRVLRTVKGILNKLTPEKFDVLKGQLIDSGIKSADILKDVVCLIFDKAVLESTFCPMYALLCSDLNEKLPPFPSDEPGGKEITFKRVLMDCCQEAFEGADKLRVEVRHMTAPEQETERWDMERLVKVRTLGDIRLIGELLKRKMLPEKIGHHIVQQLLGSDSKSCPVEENVEAICQLFNTIGKQLDESQKSRRINDIYFSRLKDLSTNPQLVSQLRFMVRDVLDLRANNWVQRREESAQQFQNRHSEPGNRDCRCRSGQLPASSEEKSWENLRENREFGNRFDSRNQDYNQFNRQDQLNSQFARAHISSNQGGPAPTLIKAEVPWSARRGNLSEKDRVLKTVEEILNKLTPWKFDVLKGELIDSGITSADILKDVVCLIFDKAVLESTFCPMYALLCSDLNEKLPPFPSDEPGGKEITFKRVLVDCCQEAFEGADKLREEVRQMNAPEQETQRRVMERLVKVRTLGNIRLIGELLKQKMLPEKIGHHIVQQLLGSDSKSCPVEENVEAICQFFNTIGKQLDESQKSRRINDIYFSRLKDLSTNPQLVSRLRFMVRDVLDLRANNWVPRREEVKAKTITEIHSQDERNLGLRPGATASMRNNCAAASGVQGNISPSGFLISRPGTGGMMPGMPGSRKMPGMPGMDNDNWEMPRTRSMPRGDMSSMQAAGRGQSPLLLKPSALNSKLLPQGSGLISGRSSALVHGGGGASSRPSNFVSGSEPASQIPTSVKAVPSGSFEKPQTPPPKLNFDQLRCKTISLLEDYFSVRLLDEALQCVVELKAPSYHPEFVKVAISLALDRSPPCVDIVANLIVCLFIKKILTARDIGTGCVLFGSMLNNIGIDLPKAPNNFGEIIGKLILVGGLDFKVVLEILKKVEDDFFQKAIFETAKRIISAASGQALLDSQAYDIEACHSVLKRS